MAWHLAHSLDNLLKEINKKYPNRPKSSDGTIGDSAHSSRKSDHNPNSRGSVNAIDITYPGVDPKELIEAVKKHPSSSYVIFNGSIYSRTYGWKKQKYTGASPHKEHLHISILQTKKAEESNIGWYPSKKKLPKYPGRDKFKIGQKGEHVKVLQYALRNAPTGLMSPVDFADVKKFQRLRPALWPADGIVGPKTYQSLANQKTAKVHYS